MKQGFKSLAFYLVIPSFLSILFYKFTDDFFVFSQTIFYLILLLFFLLISRKNIREDFIDFKKNYKKYFKIIIIWILIEFILMVASNYIISLSLETLPNNELNNREFLMNFPILAISYLILIAPMIEEYVFRLSFKNIKNYYFYTILTSLLFTFLHLVSITDISQLWFSIPYFCMSFGFSTIYYKCQNYFASTIGHMIHNTLCVIIILI